MPNCAQKYQVMCFWQPVYRKSPKVLYKLFPYFIVFLLNPTTIARETKSIKHAINEFEI
jgi:hypothetical protein